MFQKKPFFKPAFKPAFRPTGSRPYNRFDNRFTKPNKDRINEQIKSTEVRVIDEKGTNLGVLNTQEAIKMAKDRGFDLVEITENVQPPICKIIDYGKYKYIQEKKDKKQQSSHKKIEIEGVRISLTISPHDLEIRALQIVKFFKEGHKVRVEMKLKGREKAHFDLAKEKLELFISTIPKGAKREEEIKRSPQGLAVTICQAKQEDRSQNDSK